MDNAVRFGARIKEADTLRYTPAGIPVLGLVLEHESWQLEAGEPYLARFEMQAKIIGEQAKIWQNKVGSMVEVAGFLAAYSQKYRRPILHIQTIDENKG
ncbi:primosomal replication protein N [Eikenella sp. S3360]|uniref:Replication restart protein PriB n=1 Tax=Eikenella glucosivorans TaxID=2766967 RepID=A0ABS0N8F2_9NEIS|nr:primosomal replication protein N [Eikenella glucosivorans]MBH5328539.1 primosomal replication protein N [Eikenella glucosivorans]